MVSQASCYNTGDGGRRYNRPYPPPPPYLGYHDRSRFHPSSHDGRSSVAMTDSQHDVESTQQQRKRIAVACGRCRKRKIRCSGDLGHGQPCQNCKNAGADQCLFLRVSSREAPLLPSDAGSPNHDHHFGYSVSDARVLASRNGSLSMPTGYPQPSPDDVLPYRPPQPYTPTTTTAAAAYGKYYPPYPYTTAPGTTDDFDFIPSQPVDPMPMVPTWRPVSAKPYAPPLYLDPPSYPYASLVHRPAAEYTDPSPTTRLLPEPARSYNTKPSPAPAGVNALAEAANYVSAYDGSGLSYAGSTASKEGYVTTAGTGGESLFGEQERSLQTQGGGFDMTAYAATGAGEGRREVGGGTLANGHAYVPSESPYAPALGGYGGRSGSVDVERVGPPVGGGVQGVQGVSVGRRS